MDTSRAFFFAAALQLLASTSTTDKSALGHIINQLASKIEEYSIPEPSTVKFKENDIDLHALQFVPHDCPEDFVPIKTTGDGNCFYNAISISLCGHEGMSTELRVRTGIALYQMTSLYLNENSQAVQDLIKEQILLYAPFANQNYNIGKTNLSKEMIEMVLKHEIEDTFKDTCWAGMWQIQALATALNVSILSTYPTHNIRIRHLFNRLVTPFLPYDQTIFIIPILWTGTLSKQGFHANHFVPLIHKTRVETCQNIPENIMKTENSNQSTATFKSRKSENTTEHENEHATGTTKHYTSSYRCSVYLPKHYCNICEKLICAVNPQVQTVSVTNTTYICSYCKRHMNNDTGSPLDVKYIKPGLVPTKLRNLTRIELNLVSLIHPYMNLLKLPVGGQYGQRGQSISIPIPIQQLHSTLPVQKTSVTQPYIVITTPQQKQKEHTVNYSNVHSALKWLVENNEHYKDVKIVESSPSKQDSDKMNNTIGEEVEQNEHETHFKCDDGENQTTNEDIQHLSLIPTDYIIPKGNKDKENIPKHDLPYFKTKPVNIFEHPCAEELAFPNLFPYGIKGYRSVHPNTTFQQYITCRLLNTDTRWAQNISYIFWALNFYEQLSLQSSISIALRINPQSKSQLKAEHILQKQYTQYVSEDFRFMKQIKGTASYWREQLYNLLAKINILGPPTFFLSLSSNDSNWHELYQFIDPSLSENEVLSLTTTAKSQMLRENPVKSALYFSKRWETFLRKVILGPKKPLGEIVDHFSRIEFQNRGSPHVHAFLWVKDAPNMETIIGRTQGVSFIDKYIKAQLPKEEDTLHSLVKTLQTHNHTHTCYKSKSKSQCRFDFPRQTSASTQMELSNISSTTGRFYKLQRKEDSIWINPYNPDILSQWNANMDIQIVGCKYAAAAYVCTYVCKNEPESLKKALSQKIQTLPENASLRKRLSRLGNILLTHRVISAQEAVFRLLSLNLVHSSRETIYINSNPENKRFRILKPKVALEKLPGDSTQIFAQSIHEIYMRRPNTDIFINMCLVHFATHYVLLKSQEKVIARSILGRYPLQGNPPQYVRERHKQACFRTYIPKITENAEGHYHGLLCLFLPWRNSADIKGEYKSYQEAFMNKHHLIQKDCLEQFNYTEKLLSAIQQIKSLAEEQQSNAFCAITPAFMQEKTATDADVQPVDSLFTFCTETETQQHEDTSYSSVNFKELAHYTMTDTEYQANITNCNVGQKHVLGLIDKYILEQSKPMDEQEKLHLYITGGAGCGKSFVLRLIREHLLRKNKSTFPNVIVTAPTGVAAYNIKGWTIHKMLCLNVQHKKQAEYTPLNAKQLNRLRELFVHVKVLIIDEISMVSINTLLHIHKRLTEIKDTSNNPGTFFGGLHILTFGDLFQLRPVYGSSIFKDHDAMCGTHLWRDLFFCEELTENVRQIRDPQYANLLNRIRTGSHTKEDIQLLRTKTCEDTSDSPMQHIFPTKDQCKNHNSKQLQYRTSRHNPIHDIYAIDDPADEDIPEDDSFCGGLPKKLSLCNGTKVMLLRNLETDKGLVNGAQGCVVKINWSDTQGMKMPYSIDILFDNPEVGGVFEENKHQPITIKPITVTFHTTTHKVVTRTQFPLNISFAVTVHKVQGLTLDEAAVSIGEETFNAGMAYVALSRISTLQGLTLLDICPSKIYASESVKSEMIRLRSKKLQL